MHQTLNDTNLKTPDVEALMRLSDDDLFAISQQALPEQQQFATDLIGQVNRVCQLKHRKSREIALGTVITQPIQKEFGYRYTGFIAIERSDAPPLLVPYDLSDVVNRDDRHMQQNMMKLLRQPGRQVLATYNTDETKEIESLYILPFAPLAEKDWEELLTRLTLEAEGVDIAVVVNIEPTDRGGRYRLLTASGRTTIQYYQAEKQQIGNCFLIHEFNSMPLSTRYKVPESTVEKVMQCFLQNTTLDLAVHVDSHKNTHVLVTQNGDVITKRGELPPDFVYLIEETDRGKFVFHLPSNFWQPTDRSRVLQSFFERKPEAFGVVLETLKWNDNSLRARVVRAGSGEQKLKPIDHPILPGTLAYWETNQKGESFATLLIDQQIIGGCPDCFGSQYRICSACESSGWITCPSCGGTRSVFCFQCLGTGQAPCGRCQGTGQINFTCSNCNGLGTWSGSCRNCEGTGIWTGSCKVCSGTGRYADSGRTCKKCGGSGSFTLPCSRCSGTGTVSGTCKRCNGQGSWSEQCKTCHGLGQWNCAMCHGRGELHCDCKSGRIVCPTCNGNRVSLCSCGFNRGQIVPV
ncbi:MAG: hypothetical protein U0350_49180 [Caldilineaceae bacterium]